MFACFHVYFGFLGIFLPSHNRGIPLTQKMGTQVVDPWCYSLCRLVAAARVGLPQFPHFPLGQGWMVPPGASLASEAHSLTRLSLLTPDSRGHLRALRRGNLWMLAVGSQPSGEDKIRRLSCSLPHPPFLSAGKVALRVKINCLTLPTESILTLS